MKFELKGNKLTITRTEKDPKPKSEKSLLNNIKKTLNKIDFQLSMVEICKEQMMGGPGVYYLRASAIKSFPQIMIYDNEYAIRDLAEDWNANGEIQLAIEFTFDNRSIYDEQMNQARTRILIDRSNGEGNIVSSCNSGLKFFLANANN